jgi:S-(hydroxymethyl)glutathione dehydrogenase/alcohol dehydrogenase
LSLTHSVEDSISRTFRSPRRWDATGGQKLVQGVNFGSTNAKHDIPMYAELYLQGRMNLDDLVSKKSSLREVNDGYAALKDGSPTRVVVTSF